LWPLSTDFEWGNADINRAWVNDTADAVLLTAEMKSATGFQPNDGTFGKAAGEGGGFNFTYTFAFTVNGTPYAAIATMGVDGVFTLGGVASAFVVPDGNHLTLTVPKADVGDPLNGAVVSVTFT